MPRMVRDLIQHKNYANAALLSAIATHDQASSDAELRRQMHYLLLATRFWLASASVEGYMPPPGHVRAFNVVTGEKVW